MMASRSTVQALTLDNVLRPNFAQLTTSATPGGGVIDHHPQLAANMVVVVAESGVLVCREVAATQSEVQMYLGLCRLTVAIGQF
ncbi:MAG TPA: hypothetical protein VN829_04810, partial [Dongiaceae bacterium]|nr:hypothetical protein [Dongiaceae bacterium]